MTSTSFNIGLMDSKNSSRVLKPPGGGHSDIFGIHETPELVTPSKRKNVPTSTINSCFIQEEVDHKTKETEIEKVTNGKNQNGHEPDENTEPEKNNEKDVEPENTVKPVETPRRVRVPPGGFSTALW